MLDLIWIARFKDGSFIRQYDDPLTQNKEHTFKEVLDKQDDLDSFALINIHTSLIYALNLLDGTFNLTTSGLDALTPEDDMLRESQERYRLIYFRRVRRTFGLDLKELDKPKISYFLGYQYTDSDSRNHKWLVRIENDGRLVAC